MTVLNCLLKIALFTDKISFLKLFFECLKIGLFSYFTVRGNHGIVNEYVKLLLLLFNATNIMRLFS